MPSLPSPGLVFKRSTAKSNWNLELLVFVETGEPREKPSKHGENKQEAQPTREAGYGYRTRITKEGGERLSTAQPVP